MYLYTCTCTCEHDIKVLYVLAHFIGWVKSPVGTTRNLPPLKGAQSPPLGPQYEWVDVGMLDYDQNKKLYYVKRVFVPNKVLDRRPSSISVDHNSTSGGESNDSDSDGSEADQQQDQQEHIDSSDDIHYWVPRVRIMFAAENPQLFAERVANAYYLREKTEALLR